MPTTLIGICITFTYNSFCNCIFNEIVIDWDYFSRTHTDDESQLSLLFLKLFFFNIWVLFLGRLGGGVVLDSIMLFATMCIVNYTVQIVLT